MTEKISSGLADLARESALFPMEAPLKTHKGSRSLQIAVPLETSLQENRVALRPESVELLVNNGHEIIVETRAGEGSNYSDQEYSEAGAKIVYDRKEVFQSNIVLKVEPPTSYELEMMKPGITLISAFQPGSQNTHFLQELSRKRITAIGYEYLEDKVGGLPFVRAMSEIAGSSVMLIAAEYLSKTAEGGQGVILGGVTGVAPTNVVIIGAGTVGEYAARAAIGLGVDIQIFDNHIYKLRRLKHAIGHQVHTATFNHTALSKAVAEADVVIGAIRAEKGRNRIIVSEEMVAGMKAGSIVIDVSIDQGGCIETSNPTTLKNPVFTTYDVIHYCVPNIASRVPRTASMAISNIFTPILLTMSEVGGVEDMIFASRGFMKGVYTYKGSVTNQYLANKYGLPFKDLSLLMAARF
ncbi:MAG: alanine dehydrogenase [Cyclobacteriaceae bacterium]